MRVYGSNAIRNVAFVGHGACGKTSLVDALAFVSGASRRHGSIKDGTTLTDYSPDEIERKHSISLGLGYAEWLDTKINLIDTPGYLDYFGEVVTGLHAADAAVVVLSGTRGVEVGTEKAWEVCDQLHLPRMLFVSQHGQGERRFRAGLRRRQGPPDAQGRSGGNPHRRRARLPRDHQPLLRPLPFLQEGNQDRRVRRGPDSRRVSGPLPGIHGSPHRSGRVDRRFAHRALPGGRGDSPVRVHRRREEGDAGRPDRPPLLRQRRAHLRCPHAAQEDGRAPSRGRRAEIARRCAAPGPRLQDPSPSPTWAT